MRKRKLGKSSATTPGSCAPASAAIRRHTSPTSNNAPSGSKLCRPSFFHDDGGRIALVPGDDVDLVDLDRAL